ncbi:MAG: hypothetical protein LKI42_00415 [Bacteroidales bacterium]|jgi:hypothetical protein|nr:hypothetical protein [Bacteroidales bacterium]MCI1786271.1 hypothetical protein [Bacteroidales bacterium]
MRKNNHRRNSPEGKYDVRHYTGHILFFIIATLVLGLVIMLLWNAIIPGMFGIPEITFWKAIGLFILARILFGGIWKSGMFSSDGNKRRHDSYRDSPLYREWSAMTPEQRNEYMDRKRESFRHWHGGRNFDFGSNGEKDPAE